ncbi:DUF4199 domain-containing protein [Aquimarina sp. 2201CG5-10]|uniref:DUF4199 domain-containing protein n=1 Tax=Aquimarina callyspongiae TaxID=3098150 RepID=UPI002AB4435D|nr:DUF4199 domain-containing protein [Aquimarina sp. 2201CG5-10]MDY8137234.1 DUF4199 domain-containing protein [Aquimarina sp. 2201CG5-10]
MKETTVPSIKKIIITYGLVLGIILSSHRIIIYLTNNITSNNWVIAVTELMLLTSVIIYGIYKYKKSNDDFLKLGQAMKIGIGVSFIGGIVTFIWFLLLLNVIDPDVYNRIVQAKLNSGISNNSDISQEQIERSIAVSETFSSSYMLTAFLTVSNLLFGSIISLIGGVIMYKKKTL